MRASLLLLLVACERASAPPPPPPHEHALRYAAKTEVATGGINDNYFLIDEDARLFIVAIGETSRPAAEAMAPYPPKGCPQSGELAMQCALEHANDGNAIAAMTNEGDDAMVGSLGEARILFRHKGTVSVISGHDNLTFDDGDTIAITNQALIDAVGLPRVQAALPAKVATTGDLEHVINTVIDEAKQKPHRAVTLILVQRFAK